MESKLLKPYKGFIIEKSWDKLKGVKINIIYTAYTGDGKGVYDVAKTLSELKRRIDDYFK